MTSSRFALSISSLTMLVCVACSSSPPDDSGERSCFEPAPFSCFGVWPGCCSDGPVAAVCGDEGWECPAGTFDHCDCAPPLDGGADAGPIEEDAGPSDAGLCPAPEMVTGGGCTYVNVPGIARIVAIESGPPASDYACMNDPVRVLFDFVPERTELTACYEHPATPDTGREYHIFGGAHPSRACVEALGFEVGQELASVRKDITAGGCTPVVFEIVDDEHYTRCAPPVCEL